MKLTLTSIVFAVLSLVLLFSVHAQEKRKQIHEIDKLLRLSDDLAEKDPLVSQANARTAIELSRREGYRRGEGCGMQQYAKASMRMSQFDTAKQMLDYSQKILVDLKDSIAIAEGYNLIGLYYISRGMLDSAFLFSSKGMNLAIKIGAIETVGRSKCLTGFISAAAGDFTAALRNQEEAEKIAIEIKDNNLLANVHDGRAIAYFGLSKYADAKNEYSKAMELYEALGHESRITRCKHGLARIYESKGEYDKALTTAFEGLRIAERFPSKENIAMILNFIGTIHYEKEELTSARIYYARALLLYKQIGNIRQISGITANIANIYAGQKKYDSALVFYRSSLKLAEKTGSKSLLTFLYNNTASAHFDMGTYDSALYLSKRALDIAHVTENTSEVIRACSTIGQSLVKLGRGAEGMRYLKRSLAAAKESGTKDELKDMYKAVSETFSWTGNLQEALEYHLLHDSIANIIADENMNKNIREVEAKYEVEKKDKTLAQNNLVLQEQRLSLAKNEVFIAVLTSGILLLLMIGLFLRYKQKKRHLAMKLEYDRKHLKIEQQLALAQLKSDVFTNVSHEFRTPLTLLLTPLEQIIKETENETQKQRYEMMQRNANQLLGMVNQLLELSKIESGHDRLRVARYDIVNFLREIITVFEPLKEKQQISILLLNELTQPHLYFDREKLEKVFYNLLSNAFKYSARGQSITICLHTKSDSNTTDFPEGFVEIIVKDTGKGIASEHIPFIFNRFYQVDNHAENGSGIGLALVKEIVEMHSGEIKVKSEPGAGTEFTLSLPVGNGHFHPEELLLTTNANVPDINHGPNKDEVKKPTHTDEAQTIITPDIQTVLIVEDNQDLNKYVGELFVRSYNVIHASDGKQGLALAIQHSPDLVICDVMMPVMDGYAFTLELKNNFETSHIPVILLTAKADQKHKLQGLGVGADDYITKPFHVEELLIRSENLMAQRKKLRSMFSNAPFTQAGKFVPSERDHKFLQNATDVVIAHIDDVEFNVEKFSREIGMSYAVLHKKLKAITGHHVTKFIRCIRLKKAIELIESDAGTMQEIATWVGFNNRQFFIRSFREQYGMTPSEYKISHRERRSSPHIHNEK
jgi:signal transduction histidine kinase/DNA-binding response OmpR family regulator